ncbi:GNAT family N-acetyltransferase [Spirosoma sp. KCTC 42546]|uniref:GNAT family N-acetyltransferase n=1 Tax=Spirosoma sp. KCTC 42546 TaxID=2520506 RepID=UPI0011587FEF|nr:GNAT family N-acetyltransferase [Spirosoma sp. KCTC 42546]QDK82618.1 GNAT family N-acetyltransferase [Spirosoma sp. KCTC 42546]
MKVFAVHGIRRYDRWYEKFEQIPEVKKQGIEVVPFDYGFFSFGNFLIKKRREVIIDKFCKFYDENTQDTEFPPSVIAHSFGTYIVYMAMLRYDAIKFDKIIFCGSILNSNINFRSFFEKGQIQNLLNDIGARDWFIKFTRYLIDKNCGNAGEVGFMDIPPKYNSIFRNRPNNLRHSDYFLPLHMKGNWLPFLASSNNIFTYNKNILRREVIDRIYKNIESAKNNLDTNEVKFHARIDKAGNYYAKYEQLGLNNHTNTINSLEFSTTADGYHTVESMNFSVYDKDNSLLQYDIIEDVAFSKSIKVHLNNPLRYKENFYIKLYFCWIKTIEFKGDTDHWSIKDIHNVKIFLNFPYELKSPRIYEVKDKEIVGQQNLVSNTEKDGSITYSLDYTNSRNVDGLIFYFEGHKSNSNASSRFKQSTIHINERKKKKYNIVRATVNDAKKIYQQEVDIELSNAASEETIKDRINMFNDGFLIIKNVDNGEVIAYIESVIWNQKPFQRFEEISNFPMHYNITGDSLYVIFLAVKKIYRRKGIATKLLNEIEKVAKNYELNVIRLVAKDDLISFYEKRGYKKTIELPYFLENRNYKSILMEKNI